MTFNQNMAFAQAVHRLCFVGEDWKEAIRIANDLSDSELRVAITVRRGAEVVTIRCGANERFKDMLAYATYCLDAPPGFRNS